MDYFKDKTILITGGTGSFGTNFIKYFLKEHAPKRIRIYSRDEHKQEDLLTDDYYGGILDGFIGDIRDEKRLRRAMEGVDIILHAAALKHVQSCEYNPFETVQTNILGSMNVANCALDAGVEKVLAISTDKAVAPLNLYGATKMCMEKLLIQANNYRGHKKTKICCVRYGNVAGARSTVIPLWRNCSLKNIPIPITNSQSTRFWMDMSEAVEFILTSLQQMDTLYGGEIMIPKLPSFKLMDLFHAMFSQHDFTIIGDRMGDKVHETLILENEMHHTVDMAERFVIYPEQPKWEYYQPKGVPCGNRHHYSSDNNNWFLSIEDIRKKLEKIA